MSAFAGKVALITGGTKGIGRATALSLVRQGAKVVVNYGRDTKAAEEFVAEAGGEAHATAIQADAGKIPEIEKLVSQTVSKFGKIDILIPNAGLLLMKTVEATTEADFDNLFSVNVKGPYFLVQKALPYLSQGSRIVLISTTQNAASTVAAPYTLYCTSKGAIEQLTRLLSKDLAGRGITVNSVAPGPTGTDLFYRGKSEQVLQALAALNPNNRIGKPEEVADAIVYLANPSSSWITGQVVRVNGGQA